MKRLRHFCAVSILTFMLTLSAFAGDIECGVVSPPPKQTTSVMGNIGCGVTALNETSSAETASVDPLTEITLNILQSLLSLF